MNNLRRINAVSSIVLIGLGLYHAFTGNTLRAIELYLFVIALNSLQNANR